MYQVLFGMALLVLFPPCPARGDHVARTAGRDGDHGLPG
jgi:hypothetical protein